MTQADTERFQALIDCVVARCSSAGYIAPEPWVRWLLRLEIEHRARRDQQTPAQAQETMTAQEAVELADELIQTVTESN